MKCIKSYCTNKARKGSNYCYNCFPSASFKAEEQSAIVFAVIMPIVIVVFSIYLYTTN